MLARHLLQLAYNLSRDEKYHNRYLKPKRRDEIRNSTLRVSTEIKTLMNYSAVELVRNLVAHGDAREGK